MRPRQRMPPSSSNSCERNESNKAFHRSALAAILASTFTNQYERMHEGISNRASRAVAVTNCEAKLPNHLFAKSLKLNRPVPKRRQT